MGGARGPCWAIILLLTVGKLEEAEAIIGYDCRAEGTVTKALDLTEPGRCLEPRADFIEPPEWKQVAVVHKKKHGSVTVKNCNFRVTREAVRCGFTSITYAPTLVDFEEPVQLTREQCEEVIESGLLRMDGKTFALPYSMTQGVVGSFKTVSEGATYTSGACETASFTRHGIKFGSHYEYTIIRGMATDKVLGWADPERNKLQLADSQLLAEYNAGRLEDTQHGYFFWDTMDPEEVAGWHCSENIERVYLGVGALYFRRNQPGSSDPGSAQNLEWQGNVVVVQNAIKKQAFAVVLGERTQLCNQSCFDCANLPGFYACFDDIMGVLRPARSVAEPDPPEDGENYYPPPGQKVMDVSVTDPDFSKPIQLEEFEMARYGKRYRESPLAQEALSLFLNATLKDPDEEVELIAPAQVQEDPTEPRRKKRSGAGKIAQLRLDLNRADEGEIRRAISWARADLYYFQGQLAKERAVLNITKSLCQVERKTLYNKLQMLAGSDNKYALLDVFGPGHDIVSAGATVAYVVKCVPRDFTLASYPNCTTEIPVKEKGKEASGPVLFLDPLTYVLRTYPEIVVCSGVYEVRYKYEGKWFCASPAPRVCESEPDQLWPQVAPFHEERGFTDVMTHAFLMNPDEMTARDQRMEQASYRKAMVTNMVRNSLESASGHQLGDPLSNAGLGQIVYRARQMVLLHITPGYIYYLFGQSGHFVTTTISMAAFGVSVTAGIFRFGYEFHRFGWNGGRTLWRAFCAMFGVVTLGAMALKKALGTKKAGG